MGGPMFGFGPSVSFDRWCLWSFDPFHSVMDIAGPALFKLPFCASFLPRLVLHVFKEGGFADVVVPAARILHDRCQSVGLLCILVR